MDTTVIIIISLAILGIICVVAEIFLPGGVLGILGCLMVVVSIVMGFQYNLVTGLITLISTVLGGGALCLSVFKMAPKMSFSKGMFLTQTAEDWSATDPELEGLLGKEGVSQTMLRPSGFALIGDKR
ncbi:MAG: hypothetical protein HRT89_07030, partial [Lentisphaeria bacterium]|nr:hypothetical protein [Lentisphaeria bacterium]NQZ67807.1 hypothetical protein [Lentisphaeria bacterium]